MVKGVSERAVSDTTKMIRAKLRGRGNRLFVLPATIWFLIFLIGPLASIIYFSFWTFTGFTMIPDYTGQNYVDFFSSLTYVRTLLNTLKYTGVTIGISLVVGYIVSFYLVFYVKKLRNQIALFLVCLIPFWTSYLIRALAWVPMLGKQGILNSFLIRIGAVNQPVEFLLFSDFALYLALVQLYTLLMIGPIFFSLSKIDKYIIEAARDMGANSGKIFTRIILPMSMPGVAIGCVFVFVLVMGEFATAMIIGGGKVSMVGTVIQQLLGIAQYPFAAVNAIVLIIVMMVGVFLVFRAVDIRKEL